MKPVLIPIFAWSLTIAFLAGYIAGNQRYVELRDSLIDPKEYSK